MPNYFIIRNDDTYQTSLNQSMCRFFLFSFLVCIEPSKLQLAGYTQSTNDHYYQGFNISIGLSAHYLTVCSCSSASTGKKKPSTRRKVVATTFHLEDTMIFGKKVCRKNGDVSLTRLSHLLPGCMTEGILGTLSYAYGVKRFKKIQRTRPLLACPSHVVKSL